jgi:hypothetical protein
MPLGKQHYRGVRHSQEISFELLNSDARPMWAETHATSQVPKEILS